MSDKLNKCVFVLVIVFIIALILLTSISPSGMKSKMIRKRMDKNETSIGEHSPEADDSKKFADIVHSNFTESTTMTSDIYISSGNDITTNVYEVDIEIVTNTVDNTMESVGSKRLSQNFTLQNSSHKIVNEMFPRRNLYDGNGVMANGMVPANTWSEGDYERKSVPNKTNGDERENTYSNRVVRHPITVIPFPYRNILLRSPNYNRTKTQVRHSPQWKPENTTTPTRSYINLPTFKIPAHSMTTTVSPPNNKQQIDNFPGYKIPEQFITATVSPPNNSQLIVNFPGFKIRAPSLVTSSPPPPAYYKRQINTKRILQEEYLSEKFPVIYKNSNFSERSDYFEDVDHVYTPESVRHKFEINNLKLSTSAPKVNNRENSNKYSPQVNQRSPRPYKLPNVRHQFSEILPHQRFNNKLIANNDNQRYPPLERPLREKSNRDNARQITHSNDRRNNRNYDNHNNPNFSIDPTEDEEELEEETPFNDKENAENDDRDNVRPNSSPNVRPFRDNRPKQDNDHNFQNSRGYHPPTQWRPINYPTNYFKQSDRRPPINFESLKKPKYNHNDNSDNDESDDYHNAEDNSPNDYDDYESETEGHTTDGYTTAGYPTKYPDEESQTDHYDPIIRPFSPWGSVKQNKNFHHRPRNLDYSGVVYASSEYPPEMRVRHNKTTSAPCQQNATTTRRQRRQKPTTKSMKQNNSTTNAPKNSTISTTTVSSNQTVVRNRATIRKLFEPTSEVLSEYHALIIPYRVTYETNITSDAERSAVEQILATI